MQANYVIQHAATAVGFTLPADLPATFSPSITDPDGYPVPQEYGPAVDRLVYGWYPQTSEIPVGNDELAQRVITNKIVMVPDVSPYKPGDRIAFPGDDITDDESAYQVSEDVRDFNTGPFGYKPGGAIVVERVRG